MPKRRRMQQEPKIVKVGNTIRAGPGAQVGDRGTVDGVEYTIRDREELRMLIEEGRWADVARTCTSLITDFSELFRLARDFNECISHWDTSSVTNMARMFRDATAFNQPIGDWDTRSRLQHATQSAHRRLGHELGDDHALDVRPRHCLQSAHRRLGHELGDDMGGMFSGATAFNQPIGDWDTSSVTTWVGCSRAPLRSIRPSATGTRAR
jgi:surface protein